MGLAAGLLALVFAAPVDQMQETGLSVDCALRPLAKTATSPLDAEAGAKEQHVYAWFGRVHAFKRELGDVPVALTVDPDQLLSNVGEGYQAIANWPQSFAIRTKRADGVLALVVNGLKPIPDKPGHFNAMRAFTVDRGNGKTSFSKVLVGSCQVSPGVPYSVYAARKSAT